MRVDVGPVDQRPPIDDADWVAISDLARIRGVSKQAISKRVKAFTTAGRLPARGEGRGLRVHRPTFDELAAVTRDPAQDLRNRHNHGDRLPFEADAPRADAPIIVPDQEPRPSAASAFDIAATRDKLAMAELRELQLAEKQKELIPVEQLNDALVDGGTKLRQSIESLKTMSGKLYAAAHMGGEEAVHVMLTETINDLVRQIESEMMKCAASMISDEA